jgi:hypothetical protein
MAPFSTTNIVLKHHKRVAALGFRTWSKVRDLTESSMKPDESGHAGDLDATAGAAARDGKQHVPSWRSDSAMRRRLDRELLAGTRTLSSMRVPCVLLLPLGAEVPNHVGQHLRWHPEPGLRQSPTATSWPWQGQLRATANHGLLGTLGAAAAWPRPAAGFPHLRPPPPCGRQPVVCNAPTESLGQTVRRPSGECSRSWNRPSVAAPSR